MSKIHKTLDFWICFLL